MFDEELQENNIDDVISEENLLLNKTNTNVLLQDDTIYNVCKNINTILSLLTFVIIIIFLYKYLKTTFNVRKG